MHPLSEEKILQRRIGRAIWRHRLLRGLTRSALARALGIEAAQISGYETGSYAIGAARLVRVVGMLGMPAIELLELVYVTGAQDPRSRSRDGEA